MTAAPFQGTEGPKEQQPAPNEALSPIARDYRAAADRHYIFLAVFFFVFRLAPFFLAPFFFVPFLAPFFLAAFLGAAFLAARFFFATVTPP